MPTLSSVLALARGPRVRDTALAHHSGLRHQEVVEGCVCVYVYVYVYVKGNHPPHPRVALQHSSIHNDRELMTQHSASQHQALPKAQSNI